ncbi:hypothetical protein [Hydrogenophaga laconesensis]|uniref:Uncharacterized protein n=1 Tax=Hydrogenophaga laconesensis TaxID=1805971 RepID=A0ABU1VDK9_9BURK|nr:hypothetical protein [Hydrogenophaga laconesensis]MDR7095542.1 hypothetical protein [Hydrogenophaga laconesensis]
MSPNQFAAALRDFAAATATTGPDVSALALLIAQAVEPTTPTAHPDLGADDEPVFPPLDPVVATVAGRDYSAADLLRLARDAYEPGPEAFDALPAEEQSLHAQLALSTLQREHANASADAA